MKVQQQSYESMLRLEHIYCPNCGEKQWIEIDCSVPEDSYYQDCEVCCQSMVINMTADINGTLLSLTVKREDDS